MFLRWRLNLNFGLHCAAGNCRRRRDLRRRGEQRDIGPGRKRKTEFSLVTGLLIVLFNSFSDFRSGDTNDWVGGRIVVGISSEYFDTQRTFFQEVVSSFQRVAGDESSETGIAFAAAKGRAGQYSL